MRWSSPALISPPLPISKAFQEKKKRFYHLLHIYYAPGPFIHDLILTSILWVLSLACFTDEGKKTQRR